MVQTTVIVSIKAATAFITFFIAIRFVLSFIRQHKNKLFIVQHKKKFEFVCLCLSSNKIIPYFYRKFLNQIIMRKFNLPLLAMITCLIVSCNTQKPENEAKNESKTETKEKIRPTELTLQSDIMTPEVLWAMGRIGEYSLSPDHSQIVYNVTYYSVPENRSGSTLYIMNADGSDNKVLVVSNDSQYSPQWRASPTCDHMGVGGGPGPRLPLQGPGPLTPCDTELISPRG